MKSKIFTIIAIPDKSARIRYLDNPAHVAEVKLAETGRIFWPAVNMDIGQYKIGFEIIMTRQRAL